MAHPQNWAGFSSLLQFNTRSKTSSSACASPKKKGKDLKKVALTGDWLITGVQLWFHSPHGVITLRVWGQPFGQRGLAQDAVKGRDRLAELSHKVLLRGQQHRVPGRDVQLSSRAPIFLGENASWKVCVERVQVRPMEEKSVRYFLLQKWFNDGKNAFKYSRFIHHMNCFYPNGETILWGKGTGC